MGKIEEAQAILAAWGLPPAQQNEMSALTLLALCGVRPGDPWSKAQRQGLTITKGIMAFVAAEYKRSYAPNTRETFRRQVLHQFVQAGIAEYNPFAPDLPTNSPRAHYALTEAALRVVRVYGTEAWATTLRQFIEQQGSLAALYQKRRSGQLVPVRLPEGVTLELSPGRHNQVQAAVVEQFVPRFTPGAELLYLGDTAKKAFYVNAAGLAALHLPLTEHEKLPDLVLHDSARQRLFLIEVVTSHGPVTPKRLMELQSLFAACPAELVFVSAFPDFKTFRKYLQEIAWETEVWIAEIPEHMIHFNGERWLSPK